MWTARTEEIAPERCLRITIDADAVPMSFADVLSGWRGDAGFRRFFTQLLADAPFDAFRWETPPVSAGNPTRGFEFVLWNSPGLAAVPDPEAFAEHFGAAASAVVEFANLRGDAILVVPVPLGPETAYGHLAAFVRHAPESQQHALWEQVGDAMERRVGARPVWLSTAGAGVSWLHVRLDDRPKYYGYEPYRRLS